MMWGYGYGWPGMSWGGMALMSIGMVLWLLFLGLLVWGVVRWLTHPTSQPGAYLHSGPSASEILEQRYARGEIDEATFDHMRAELAETAQTESKR